MLSSALDSGTVIAVMFIFFALQFPRGGSIMVNWWGNMVYQQSGWFLFFFVLGGVLIIIFFY